VGKGENLSMKNRLIALTVILLSLSTHNVFATVTETKIERNFSENEIKITGKADKNEQISIHIIDKSFDENKTPIESQVAYAGQMNADSEGAFCFVAEIQNSGEYKALLANSSLEEDAVNIPIEFYNKTDYSSVINQLSGKTEAEFIEMVTSNVAVLGFNEEINNIVDIEKTAKIMYDSLDGKDLSAERFTENCWLYRNSAMIVAANEGKLDSIYKYAENLIENGKMAKYWERYITSTEKENYAVKKLENRNIKNVNELEKNISEVLILTATYYPDGYMSLKDLYSDFKDILNVTSVSSSSTVYSKLAGKQYENIESLRKAYMDAVNNRSTSGGSGGSGGGGGGSSSGGSKITMDDASIREITGEGEYLEVPDAIELKFMDLSSVRWAYPSISVLFDLGIVNGVSETEFSPMQNVKREEFTKMLMLAMNKKTDAMKNVFKDVDESAWYAGYVNLAYSEKIVNGTSDGEFGIGQNITRQDMAVMVYRAMLSKGYVNSGAEMNFSDKTSIADYATESIAELSKIGIVNGQGDNMFAPFMNASRAEAAVMIERALKYLQ